MFSRGLYRYFPFRVVKLFTYTRLALAKALCVYLMHILNCVCIKYFK